MRAPHYGPLRIAIVGPKRLEASLAALFASDKLQAEVRTTSFQGVSERSVRWADVVVIFADADWTVTLLVIACCARTRDDGHFVVVLTDAEERQRRLASALTLGLVSTADMTCTGLQMAVESVLASDWPRVDPVAATEASYLLAKLAHLPPPTHEHVELLYAGFPPPVRYEEVALIRGLASTTVHDHFWKMRRRADVASDFEVYELAVLAGWLDWSALEASGPGWPSL